jgi:hypothetical protein
MSYSCFLKRRVLSSLYHLRSSLNHVLYARFSGATEWSSGFSIWSSSVGVYLWEDMLKQDNLLYT